MPDFVTEKKINKILIIRLSSLGDILLTTPVIRALKEKFPGAQVDFTVKNQYKDALSANPNLSNFIIYDKKENGQIAARLATSRYDLIIDLQNNFRSRKLIRGLNGEKFRFRKPSLKKFLLVRFKLNLMKDLKTISQRYAETANVSIDDKGLELFIPSAIKTKLPKGENYIGFCPGSRHYTKRWPPEYFAKLGNELNLLGFKIILFGGKDDSELCASLNELIENSVNLQNDDILLQTAADMRECKMIVTNDSGLMHTASALGIPIVSIFGSTVKEFGFVPQGTQNLILENKSLSCRPCSHVGRAECPQKHFKCMNDLTPESVLYQIKNFQRGL